MNENIWCMKDVMDYFGELFRQDEETQKKAREGLELIVKVVESESGHRNYFAKMNRVREILIAKGCDVPFRAVYRRAK